MMMMMMINEGDCLLMVSAVFLVYVFNKSEKWYPTNNYLHGS